MKTTKIMSAGEDEIYCEWFRCLNCSDEMITNESNYCPNCGLKIEKEAEDGR